MGQKDGGRAKRANRKKGGQGGDVRYSFSLSHIGLLSASSMPGMIRERARRSRRKEKEGVSNSSDRGTPQRKRNCLLHCQPMATPASSPLNIKHKHNVHTSLFSKVGICGYNNRENYTPSYLHVALSDNNYKAFYQQKADKRDTEHRLLLTTKTATITLGTSRAARHAHSSR